MSKLITNTRRRRYWTALTGINAGIYRWSTEYVVLKKLNICWTKLGKVEKLNYNITWLCIRRTSIKTFLVKSTCEECSDDFKWNDKDASLAKYSSFKTFCLQILAVTIPFAKIPANSIFIALKQANVITAELRQG